MGKVANEYAGRTGEYATRTHALEMDADSLRYTGRTKVTLGVTGPDANSNLRLEPYIRNNMALSSATISQRGTLREHFLRPKSCM